MPRANKQLTHVDPRTGEARMVDVGAKPTTVREAEARGRIRISAAAMKLVRAGTLKKGDPLQVARLAGIMAAKRTSALIPLCHPLPLSFVGVEADVSPSEGTVTIVAEARTSAQTGVEMEALAAASVAALTVYDMVKGLERGVVVEEVCLLEKTGGKEDWRRAG
jgi:cyclic pyranopterin monophosphate synthase